MSSSKLYLDFDPVKVERLSNEGKTETFHQKIINSARKGDRASILLWLACTCAPFKKNAWVFSAFFPFGSYRAFAFHRENCKLIFVVGEKFPFQIRERPLLEIKKHQEFNGDGCGKFGKVFQEVAVAILSNFLD